MNNLTYFECQAGCRIYYLAFFEKTLEVKYLTLSKYVIHCTNSKKAFDINSEYMLSFSLTFQEIS